MSDARSPSSSSAPRSPCSSGTGCRSRSSRSASRSSLWATGVLELDEALAGFGDPTVIFIASLFVVSEALDAAGVTSWAGQQLIARVGDSRTRLIVLTMLLVAVLTALISVNGAVAALIPVTVVLAIRLGRPPSQLLLPLAFGAHAGSLLALTGTPVNVIVSDAAADAGVGRFGFLEFGLVGVPLVAGTIAIVWLFGERLLPAPRRPLDHARLQRSRAHADRAVPARARRGRAADAHVGRRRDRRAAAVRAGRRARVPRHGHRQRRPRRARRAAAGRGAEPASACWRPATRCWSGDLARPRPASRRRPRGRSAGARAPGDAAGRRGEAGDRGARRDGRRCSRPARSRPRSPACSPPARSSCSACCRSTRPTGRSRGRP